MLYLQGLALMRNFVTNKQHICQQNYEQEARKKRHCPR